MPIIRVLELFSGTGSVSKVCQQLSKQTGVEVEVVSVDISDQFHTPTIMTDIMEWDYKSAYPKGYFHIVWASPPCNTFSPINRQFRTIETIRENIEAKGLPLLRKAEEIIDYYQPTRWVMENPRGYMHEYITDRPKHRVDYCRYADWGYQKPTHIWTNHPTFVGKTCKNQCNSRKQDSNRHVASILRKKGIEQRDVSRLNDKYRVPPQLVKELIEITPDEDIVVLTASE